ncbi:MAG: asparaginase domain-containing protein [Spirochaetales bacterium]|nr:asparaginase domain-containing protein [Spirochaetales bacterium]
MQNRNIRLIVTGGTFDKRYDPIKGLLDFKKTHLPEILKIVRPNINVILENKILVDSLEMTDEDRNQILESCKESEEQLIIITHGTDTMSVTAEALGRVFSEKDKTIVLTGAMVPYTITGSDALFNLGSAFAAVQLLSPGVYISMNADIFPWNNVKKNKAEGRFQPLKK